MTCVKVASLSMTHATEMLRSISHESQYLGKQATSPPGVKPIILMPNSHTKCSENGPVRWLSFSHHISTFTASH